MASNEDNDEAEQLRFLALKSMVKRSKQNNSDNDADDQDIKLLRAAALKTITHKNNAQNHSLVDKDDKLVKSQIVNEKKRSISSLSSMRNKKSIKRNENKTTDSKHFTNNSILRKSSEVLNHEHEQEYKRKPKLEYNTGAQSKPEAECIAESHYKTAVSDSKDDFKKIVRNGSMQLSNLDSEKIDETMVLHITFSSSESEDSSSECDTIKKEVVTQNTRYNNVKNQLAPVKIPVDVQPTNSVSLEDNKIKMNDCLKKLCVLMRNCEDEIEKRNQQVEILLEAYEKYQNHNKSLSSILQMMKTIRDELSIYHSIEANALNN